MEVLLLMLLLLLLLLLLLFDIVRSYLLDNDSNLSSRSSGTVHIHTFVISLDIVIMAA